MAAIDKAAIGWTMGIVAAAMGIAAIGAGGGIMETSMPDVSMPSPDVIPDEPTPTDPFAEAAEKAKERAAAMEEQMKMAGEKESAVTITPDRKSVV